MRNEVCDLPMIIDYLGHSGFFVETDSVLLLFDYYCGDLSFLGQKPDEKPLILSVLHPRYVLPMHFWEDRSIVDRFKELPVLRESSETILLDTTKETHWEI
jgi:L-ascorbate metabolism protein UlaG (beta-lactamase superfamily)